MLKPLDSPFGVQRLASTGTRASACWDGRMGVFYEVQIKCLCVILTMIPTEFEPPSSPIKMGNLTIRLIRQKSWKCSLLTTKICFTLIIVSVNYSTVPNAKKVYHNYYYWFSVILNSLRPNFFEHIVNFIVRTYDE